MKQSALDSIAAELTPDPLTGQELRKRLNAGKRWWQRWTVVGFYMTMMKLEDAGTVTAYNRTNPDGFIERVYRLEDDYARKT